MTALSPEGQRALDTMLASLNDTLTGVRYELGAIVFDLASGRAIECIPSSSYVVLRTEPAAETPSVLVPLTVGVAVEGALLRALVGWVDRVLADAVDRASWPTRPEPIEAVR